MAEYRTQTMRTHDRLAVELAEGFDGFFETFAWREAACFLAGLDRDGTILDLGCGGGPASKYFVECGYSTVSADLSEGMLRECRMRGLMELVRLDLEILPFPHRSFAAIWAHTSLVHVPKVRLTGVMEALGEILKPGGRVFVVLREGVGEGYQGELGVERWFSNFGPHEFEAYIPDRFRIARRTRTGLKTAFLGYHLMEDGRRR
jgi:SAM-dependent methyltransferase